MSDLDIWVKISGQIGELNASVQSVLTQLTNHNQRIQALEERDRSAPKVDWKDEIEKAKQES